MSSEPEEFEFRQAERKDVHFLIALAGASGSGKTKTALELAYGLADGDESKIGMIDTEAKRGLHYARVTGETAESAPDKYGFLHSDMLPPFRPERFERAIAAAERAELKVLIIDSFSHEYDGEGGIMDWNAELAEGTPKPGITEPRDPKDGDGWKDWLKKPIDGPGAWKEPKAAHKHLVQTTMLQARCHLIVCLRAEEKIKILKRGDTKADGTKATGTAIESMGWMPICEKRFMYEMTLSLTLSPSAPGEPQWDLPHKVQDQHLDFFPEGQKISRAVGKKLAAWAAGKPATPQKAPAAPMPAGSYETRLDGALARAGDASALTTWWNSEDEKTRRSRLSDEVLSRLQQKVTEKIAALTTAS